MKYKYLRKVLSMAVALSLVMHSVVYNGWGVKEVEACNPTQIWGGTNAVGLNIRLSILPAAETAILTRREVYQQVVNWGGWHGVESSKWTINVAVLPVAQAWNANVWVGGQNIEPVPLPGGVFEHTLGFITPVDINGGSNVNLNWTSVSIIMNTRAATWGATLGGVPAPTLAAQQNRAAHTFIHEVGHVLKLAHPQNACTQAAVMKPGVPGVPGVSRNITAHDLQAIAWKW